MREAGICLFAVACLSACDGERPKVVWESGIAGDQQQFLECLDAEGSFERIKKLPETSPEVLARLEHNAYGIDGKHILHFRNRGRGALSARIRSEAHPHSN